MIRSRFAASNQPVDSGEVESAERLEKRFCGYEAHNGRDFSQLIRSPRGFHNPNADTEPYVWIALAPILGQMMCYEPV